jgi:gas vesicle protein
MENRDNLKVVAALVAGAVVGTVLGLLFAPAKGKDTRRKVWDGAKEIAVDLKDKIRNGVAQTNANPEASKEFIGG